MIIKEAYTDKRKVSSVECLTDSMHLTFFKSKGKVVVIDRDKVIGVFEGTGDIYADAEKYVRDNLSYEHDVKTNPLLPLELNLLKNKLRTAKLDILITIADLSTADISDRTKLEELVNKLVISTGQYALYDDIIGLVNDQGGR